MPEKQPQTLTSDEAAARTSPRWSVVDDALRATFTTGDMVRGLDFVTRVVAEAEQMNHHPDVTLTYPRVELAVTTHSAGGLTDLDVDLAHRIDAVAAATDVDAAPEGEK
ncbi:4a-hydroxytetrahydrobiopterin dehydratase [Gordonia shandongensis]|uniref:4a-hydroxytetrahydrobiopterin dehydratase n=1 Tax=Gordonia shandongensis TaxID=376351 RepID=UPI00040DBCB3|nr:4a-hydroxytetrahydrobiopterin dehydratase [Gordonia shandongensis]